MLASWAPNGVFNFTVVRRLSFCLRSLRFLSPDDQHSHSIPLIHNSTSTSIMTHIVSAATKDQSIAVVSVECIIKEFDPRDSHCSCSVIQLRDDAILLDVHLFRLTFIYYNHHRYMISSNLSLIFLMGAELTTFDVLKSFTTFLAYKAP